MQILRPVHENEVIACFLKAEIASARFGAAVEAALVEQGAGRSLIDDIDLRDAEANAVRRRVLERARSWKSGGNLFIGFPPDIRWFRARLDGSDVRRIQYIDYEDWLEVSGGTRMPVDASSRIRAGEIPYAHVFEGVVAELLRGDAAFPDLIIVGEPDGSKLVVLEGHLRLTAYFVAERIPDSLEVFLGTSARLSDWSLY